MRRLLELGLLVTSINLNYQAKQPVTNSAIFATHDQVHSGESTCISTNGTSAYTCSFGLINKALLKYTVGMQVFLIPDVDSANGTLNIDQLGVISLREPDGTTGATVVHGHGYEFFYDGKVFRLKG